MLVQERLHVTRALRNNSLMFHFCNHNVPYMHSSFELQAVDAVWHCDGARVMYHRDALRSSEQPTCAFYQQGEETNSLGVVGFWFRYRDARVPQFLAQLVFFATPRGKRCVRRFWSFSFDTCHSWNSFDTGVSQTARKYTYEQNNCGYWADALSPSSLSTYCHQVSPLWNDSDALGWIFQVKRSMYPERIPLTYVSCCHSASYCFLDWRTRERKLKISNARDNNSRLVYI